jgi:hypothetical protein
VLPIVVIGQNRVSVPYGPVRPVPTRPSIMIRSEMIILPHCNLIHIHERAYSFSMVNSHIRTLGSAIPNPLVRESLDAVGALLR